MPSTAALLRISVWAAGLLLALSLLPSSAHAQCNHPFGRAFHGDIDNYVPVSRPAKNDTEMAENRKPAKTPAKPVPCQGCLDCGQNPASAPTSTFSGFELHDLLSSVAGALECDPSSRRAEHEPSMNLQQPVFAITHPPRVCT